MQPISEQLMLPCKPSPDSVAFQFVVEYPQTSSCYLEDMIYFTISKHFYITTCYLPLKNNLFNLVHLQIWLWHRNTKKYSEIQILDKSLNICCYN